MKLVYTKKGLACIISAYVSVLVAVAFSCALSSCQTANNTNNMSTAANASENDHGVGVGVATQKTGSNGVEQDFDPEKLSEVSISIYKQERRLDLLSGEDVVACYKIALGRNPEGHKRREGDGKTPEGEYYICTRNNRSNYYLSLGLSYPNIADAESGLEDGAVTQNQFNKIKASIDAKKKPAWDTPLGGEIMIHGHGNDRDWTAGCIAVDNAVMDILWACCKLKTPVTIYP
jgi:L,D-peptidoglycan transpeptidase YkuD (ErfK/YbiS/YcfS/YnhG family)